jgi:hypothetical protein
MSILDISFKGVVSRSLGLQQISNINNYIQEKNYIVDSSIDYYYSEISSLIKLSGAIEIDNYKEMGTLILLGFCSVVENYFRRIVADVLLFCPIAKKNAAEQKINLGSFLWFKDSRELSAGIYEHLSFTNIKNIEKVSKEFIGFVWDKKSPLHDALIEFDKISELRHCVAHSASFIYGKNAVKLDLEPRSKLIKLELGLKEIQECAAVCNMLVSIYNTELFKFMVERFFKDCNSSTNKKLDYNEFKELWSIFYSKIDQKEGRLLNHSNSACHNFYKKCIKEFTGA